MNKTNLARKLTALLLLTGTLIFSAAAEPEKLDRFESSISAYETLDRAHPVSTGGTLFLGSSTFTLWGKEPEEKFKAFHVVNRGFGGATIPEINHYLPRILYPYKPAQVVFYAGTNDIADGHTPQRVAADFQKFVSLAREKFPNLKIAYISMSMPPSRVKFQAQYLEANRLIQEELKGKKGLYFVDVSRLLLDDLGQPRREFFREDALHMRPAGYAVWTPHIQEILEKMTRDK